MTHFEMYLFTRLDVILIIARAVIALSLLLSPIIACIAFAENDDSSSIKLFRYLEYGLVATIISVCVLIFVPSQKDAAAIWLVPKIVNNEKLNNIADNTLEIIEKETREYLKELK